MQVMHAMQSIVDVNKSTNCGWVSTAGVSMLHGLVMRWHLGAFRFFAATCTVFGMNSYSVYLLPTLLRGRNASDIDVLGAVVLQTYITASFIIEACARLQAQFVRTDGACDGGYPQDSSEGTSYPF
jgi:hypothetical protein